mmetsp:Transcript_47530/g.150702  ORF Transcript_47530/g.150702 Transcript_47530/m.150702 type:complete len:536 (-) Transcript_47530:656-2263(-)
MPRHQERIWTRKSRRVARAACMGVLLRRSALAGASSPPDLAVDTDGGAAPKLVQQLLQLARALRLGPAALPDGWLARRLSALARVSLGVLLALGGSGRACRRKLGVALAAEGAALAPEGVALGQRGGGGQPEVVGCPRLGHHARVRLQRLQPLLERDGARADEGAVLEARLAVHPPREPPVLLPPPAAERGLPVRAARLCRRGWRRGEQLLQLGEQSRVRAQEGAEGGVGRASRGLGRAVGRRPLARRRRLLGRPKVGQQLREPLKRVGLRRQQLLLGGRHKRLHRALERVRRGRRRLGQGGGGGGGRRQIGLGARVVALLLAAKGVGQQPDLREANRLLVPVVVAHGVAALLVGREDGPLVVAVLPRPGGNHLQPIGDRLPLRRRVENQLAHGDPLVGARVEPDQHPLGGGLHPLDDAVRELDEGQARPHRGPNHEALRNELRRRPLLRPLRRLLGGRRRRAAGRLRAARWCGLRAARRRAALAFARLPHGLRLALGARRPLSLCSALFARRRPRRGGGLGRRHRHLCERLDGR